MDRFQVQPILLIFVHLYPRREWRFKGAERRRTRIRFQGAEHPGDGGEIGDLRARSAEEQNAGLRVWSARAIEEGIEI